MAHKKQSFAQYAKELICLFAVPYGQELIMRACFLGQTICVLGKGVAVLHCPPIILETPPKELCVLSGEDRFTPGIQEAAEAMASTGK